MATKTIIADGKNRTMVGLESLTIRPPTSGSYKGHLGSGQAKWEVEADGALVKAHRSGAGRGRSLDTTWRAHEMTEDFVVVDTKGKEIVSGKAGDYLVISETGKYNYGMNGGTPRPGWYNSGLKFEVVKKGDEEFTKFVALKAVARETLRS
ncbi:MAG: hypothetical protein M1569_00645 [Candidatus Marsarchaeota archaeon]|nr:hypothetical protein [Candidatus Marsarchaeota archaeon]MCL5412898.1 hypothetical protein [Candidatus Marsarchaeota archaeon]